MYIKRFYSRSIRVSIILVFVLTLSMFLWNFPLVDEVESTLMDAMERSTSGRMRIPKQAGETSALVHINGAVEAFLAAIMAVLSGWVSYRLPLRFSFIIPVLLSGVWVAVSLYLVTVFGVYLNLILPIFCLAASCLVVVRIRLQGLFRERNHRNLPVERMLELENRSSLAGQSFAAYMEELAPMVLEETGILVRAGCIPGSHPFFARRKLPEDGHIQMLKHAWNTRPRHGVVIPLPLLYGDAERHYTMLGVERGTSEASVRSVVALILSAAAYYHANQEHTKRVDQFYSMIRCMVNAIDAKDPVTSGHSQRVAELSEQIARLAGFDDRTVQDIGFAGLIHDVGKIGIPDEVLHKEGIFSRREMEMMRRHPQTGVQIMQGSSVSPEILDGIRDHHERLDGKGYPAGKQGDEIGSYARIIKIADVFDALSSVRQYKDAWPLERVCDTLYLGKGTEFDPDYIDLFLGAIAPEGWTPPVETPKPKPAPYEQVREYVRNLLEEYRHGFDTALNCAGICEDEECLRCDEGFFGMEWGERFTETDFLVQNPSLVEIEEDVCTYALRPRKPKHSWLTGLFYTFSRKFFVMGCLVLHRDSSVLLTEVLGEPDYRQEDFLCWDQGPRLVAYIRGDAEIPAMIVYLTKHFFFETV